MAIKPKAETAKRDAGHWGFNTRGEAFRSESPVDNQATNFVKALLSRIRQERLLPYQVAHRILLETGLASMWTRECQHVWESGERFHLWPTLPTGTAAEAVLLYTGVGDGSPGLWVSDPKRWVLVCDEAERLHGQRSRHSYVLHAGVEHDRFPGETPAQSIERVLRAAGAEQELTLLSGRHDG